MKKRLRKSLSLLLIIVMMLSSISFGEPTIKNEEIPIDISGFTFKGDLAPEEKLSEDLMNLEADVDEVRVIVELQKTPIIESATSMGVKVSDMNQASVMGMADAIKVEQDQVIDEMNTTADQFDVHQRFDTVFNGFSATVKVGDLEKIANIPNVKSVSISNVYERPQTMPDMTESHRLTNSKYANEELGYLGEGLVVAIIDTGIDPTHKDFIPDPTMMNELDMVDVNGIIVSEDLPGQWFTAKVPYGYNYMDNDSEIRDLGPDASMHGMHVAGTVAADGEIKGVAPKAQVLAMKVFGNDPEFPSTFGDVIIAAIDDSILLGADVMNLSLGSTAAFVDATDPEHQAVTRATNNGIVMAISAGNSAFMGYGNPVQDLNLPLAINPDIGVVGSPGLTAESIQVASVGNYSLLYVHDFVYEGLEVPVLAYGRDSWPAGTYPVVPIGGTKLGGAASDYDDLDVTGKVVLVSRGGYSFYDKTELAAEMGAIGIIVYDHGLSQFYTDQGGWSIPFMKIHKQEGLDIETIFESQEELVITVGLVEENVSSKFGQVSDFSSWGTTPDLSFKPDIAAPGEAIYSTLNNNEYGVKQGTSMAAPHVAGGSALVLERMEEDPMFSSLGLTEQAKVDFAKNVLMNTALPVKEEYGYASVRHQGAGSMDLKAALTTPAVVKDKSTKLAKVNLMNVKKGRPETFTLKLKNYSDEAIAFDFDFTAQINDAFLYTNDDGESTYYNALATDFITNYSLTVTVDDQPLNGPIVLAGEEGVKVKVTVDFTNAVNWNSQNVFDIFPNGNFVEAFVWFKPSEELVTMTSDDYDLAEEAYNDNQTLIETLKGEIEELEALIEAAETAMTDKQAEIDAAQIAVDEAMQDIDDYIAEHADEVADVTLLLAQLAEAEQNLEDAKAAYDEIRELLLMNAQAYSVADLFQGNFDFIESLYDVLDFAPEVGFDRRMVREVRRELRAKINDVITVLNEYEMVANNLVVSEDFLMMTQDERADLLRDLRVKVKSLNDDLKWLEEFLSYYQLDWYLDYLRDFALPWVNDEIAVILQAIEELPEGADPSGYQNYLADLREYKQRVKNEIESIKTLMTLEDNLAIGIELNDNILEGIKEIKERAQIVDNAQAALDLINASVQEQDMTDYEAYMDALRLLQAAYNDLVIAQEALQADWDALNEELMGLEEDKLEKEIELMEAEDATEGLLEAKDDLMEEILDAGLMRDRAVELSVPVMGFLGNFDEAPAFDAPRHDDDSYYNRSGYVTNYTQAGEEGLYLMFETSAISPNEDGYQDVLIPYLTVLRNVEDVKVQVTDHSGLVLRTLAMRDSMRKHYVDIEGDMATFMGDGEFDGTLAGEMLPEGHYNLRYEGTLNTGTTKTQDIPFMIDITPPTVGLHGYSYSDMIFSIGSEDNLSGVDTYVLLAGVFNDEHMLVGLDVIDANATGIFDLSGMAEVPDYVTYAVIDKASNEAMYDYLIPLVDGDVPVFTDIYPEAFEMYNERNFNFEAKVTDDHLMLVTVDGDPVPLMPNDEGTFSIEKAMSYETDGKKGIEVVGEDIYGNRTAFTRWFYIDSQPAEIDVTINAPLMPTADISLLKDEWNLVPYGTTSIDVNLNASDNFPYLNIKVMDSVVYLFDADFISYEDQLVPHQTTLHETINLVPGLNTWTVSAEDAYGHVTTVDYKFYVLDENMTEPTIEFVEITGPSLIERAPDKAMAQYDFELYDRFTTNIKDYVTVNNEDWTEDGLHTWFFDGDFVVGEDTPVPVDVEIELDINGVTDTHMVHIVDPDRYVASMSIEGAYEVMHYVTEMTTVQMEASALDQFGDDIVVMPVWSIEPVEMGPTMHHDMATIDQNGLVKIDHKDLTHSANFKVTATYGEFVEEHMIYVEVAPFFDDVTMTMPDGFVLNEELGIYVDEFAINETLTHDLMIMPLDQYGDPFMSRFTLVSDDVDVTLNGYEFTIPGDYEDTFTLTLTGEDYAPSWMFRVDREAPAPAAPAATPAPAVQVINVTLNETDLQLEVGTEALVTEFDLDATVTGTLVNGIVWSSSDETVATVDEDGIVTAVGVGIATITAAREIGTQSAEAEVEVFLIGEDDNPLGAVTFSEPYMTGFPDGTFRANAAITRGQLAVIYTKILGLNTDFLGEQKFDDVPKDNWAFDYVQAVQRTGIFSGYGDGTFKPDQALSRGELAATFSKYWNFKQIDVQPEAVTAVQDVSGHWAQDHIYRLYNANVLDGSEANFEPDAPALRGQVVVMMNTLIGRTPMDVDTSKFSDIQDKGIMGAIEAATNKSVELSE